MKLNLTVLLLFAITLATGCKKDESNEHLVQQALKTAKDYEAQKVQMFAYNANDLSVKKSGFAVETLTEEDGNLAPLTEFAVKNNNLLCGFRDVDGTYDYSSMEYFETMEQAMEYVQKKGSGTILDLKNNTTCTTFWPIYDEFNVGDSFSSGCVTIKCMKEMYYFVTIDLTKQSNRKQAGIDYGKCISELPIQYGARVSAYLGGSIYVEGIKIEDAANRVEYLYEQIPQEDQDMIDGMAKGLWGITAYNRAMLYTANLLPDALRPTACSGLGVMPQMSETGKTMAYRTLDWPDASIDEKWFATIVGKDRIGIVSPLQSITKFIYPDRTIYSFGMLGIICGVTSIDQTNRNMVAILDSSTGGSYQLEGKRSYVFDLAQAIRTKKTLDEIATEMTASTKNYTFNHLLLMANKEKVGFLENNINKTGTNSSTEGVRAMRYWDSKTNGVLSKWEYNHVIGSVNCFQLENQVNNRDVNPALCNTQRWGQMQGKVKELLQAKGANGKLSLPDLQTIQKSHPVAMDEHKFDNLYNYNTLQMIQYIPADNKAYVYVKPFTGKPAANPTFFELELSK